MRRSALLIALSVSACGGETSEAPTPESATSSKVAQQEVADLTERLGRATNTCQYGPSRSDPDGKLAMAEVDLAMADNIENISPSEERRIRASLGAEMGLAPSEVNGWKAIYRSRAEQAKRLLADAEAEEAEIKKDACDYIPELQGLLAEAKRSAAALSKQ